VRHSIEIYKKRHSHLRMLVEQTKRRLTEAGAKFFECTDTAWILLLAATEVSPAAGYRWIGSQEPVQPGTVAHLLLVNDPLRHITWARPAIPGHPPTPCAWPDRARSIAAAPTVFMQTAGTPVSNWSPPSSSPDSLARVNGRSPCREHLNTGRPGRATRLGTEVVFSRFHPYSIW
jgi:hypothetical protein